MCNIYIYTYVCMYIYIYDMYITHDDNQPHIIMRTTIT